MITTIVGLVLVLAAAFYVAWPLLSGAPAAADTGVATDDAPSDPEHEKDLALRAIREADFDHRTGKLSDEDYASLRDELEGRALNAMAEIDAANALHAVPTSTSATPPAASTSTARAAAEPGGFCPACGVRFARDARFCPGCGKKLPAATSRGRRRA